MTPPRRSFSLRLPHQGTADNVDDPTAKHRRRLGISNHPIADEAHRQMMLWISEPPRAPRETRMADRSCRRTISEPVIRQADHATPCEGAVPPKHNVGYSRRWVIPEITQIFGGRYHATRLVLQDTQARV